MADYFENTRRGRWREAGLAAVFFVLALFLLVLPPEYQGQVRRGVRATALQPFIALQSGLFDQGIRRADVQALRAERDSLSAVVAAQASLAEENRRLRALLGLRERAGPSFVPAEVIRIGTTGAESTFLLHVGSEHAVGVGSPVIVADGLLGVVWDVTASSSQGIDWTHPDFRASAMTSDGQAFGIVAPRRGRFREDDRLALTGTPFHSDILPGTRVVTSGRGGIFPRGILLGTVVEVEEAETGWSKSYVLRPAVRPEAATHVLVGRQPLEVTDLSRLWSVRSDDRQPRSAPAAPGPSE